MTNAVDDNNKPASGFWDGAFKMQANPINMTDYLHAAAISNSEDHHSVMKSDFLFFFCFTIPLPQKSIER